MNRCPRFKFRLYVAGETQNSTQAKVNLTALCRENAPDDHEIEIVDVLRQPKRALTDGVFMTPTLIKLSPRPILKIIGALSHPELVLRTLGLDAVGA